MKAHESRIFQDLLIAKKVRLVNFSRRRISTVIFRTCNRTASALLRSVETGITMRFRSAPYSGQRIAEWLFRSSDSDTYMHVECITSVRFVVRCGIVRLWDVKVLSVRSRGRRAGPPVILRRICARARAHAIYHNYVTFRARLQNSRGDTKEKIDYASQLGAWAFIDFARARCSSSLLLLASLQSLRKLHL